MVPLKATGPPQTERLDFAHSKVSLGNLTAWESPTDDLSVQHRNNTPHIPDNVAVTSPFQAALTVLGTSENVTLKTVFQKAS
jgi:hypothetical protein